jgi:SAM-dependent methyltransferase/methyltransferase-like protein
MPDAPVTTYDEVQYGDLVFAHTHPANLATVAVLHGLDPPPVGRCRVLDLGCAAGANLWPMALAFPESEFVGVDLSPKQIGRGRETAAALGLTNLTLHARNILDATDDFGTFDYVIAHGVYSWVPPAVQDRVLDVIHRHLAPNGVAYVSYNVYPGWHLRGMVRDMLTFHAAETGDAATQTAHARGYLDFLLSALPDGDSAYATILRAEAETLRAQEDFYLFHEYLESDNRPVYFHQFAAHAAAHGLQYLAEATPQPLPGHVKPEVLNALAAASPDRIRLEQYLDFLRCRIFRRSLLCHSAVRPNFDGVAGRISQLAVSSEAKPEADPSNPVSILPEHFATPNRLRFTTSDPAMRAVMRHLWEARPAAVPFTELLAVAKAVAPAEADLAERLAGGLLQLYLGDIVVLHLHPPALAPVAGPHPCASRLARFQATHGNQPVHDLRHRAAHPDAFARFLLPLLDGSRDRAGLVEALAARAAAGEFEVRDAAGQPATDPALVRQVLGSWVEDALGRLAKSALLTA